MRLRRLAPPLALALAVSVAGCSDDEPTAAAADDSCAAVADDGIAAFNEIFAQLEDMTLEDLEGTTEPPQWADDAEAATDELQRRTEELGCSDEEMSELMQARADDVQGEGIFAEMFREELRSGSAFDDLGGSPGEAVEGQ